MRKIKIGVLGASNHFIKRIILPLKELDNGYIYAIASRDVNKAKQIASEFNIDNYYGSYEELLHDKQVDAVYIPLPNHIHFKWIIEAAKNGKHIMCEKPITLNSRTC